MNETTEPNHTPGRAQELPLGAFGRGSIGSFDTDFWKIALREGDLVQISLSALTFDAAGWSNTPPSPFPGREGEPLPGTKPHLVLWATDGSTPLVERRYSGLWSVRFPRQMDWDIPRFLAPASGTYFLSVEKDPEDPPAFLGGEYLVRARLLEPQRIQKELERPGGGSNDVLATAEALERDVRVLRGQHEAGREDVYKVVLPDARGIFRAQVLSLRNGLSGSGPFAPFVSIVNERQNGLRCFDGSDFDDATGHLFVDARVAAGSLPRFLYLRVIENPEPERPPSGSGEYFLDWSFQAVESSVFEVEPDNDEPLGATLVHYGEILEGQLSDGDVEDYWRFDGSAGDMVFVEVHDGKTSDSDSTGFHSPVLFELLEDDGETAVPFASWNLSTRNLHTVLTRSGSYLLHVRTSDFQNTGYALFLQRRKTSIFETEPNDDLAQAEPMLVSSRHAGVIDDRPGESDVYSFLGRANEPVAFAVYASAQDTNDGFRSGNDFGSSLVPRLTILDSGGVALVEVASDPLANATAERILPEGAAASLVFLPPANGTYFLVVRDRDSGGGPEYFYLLERHEDG